VICAATALSTLALPEIAKLRPRLAAAILVYGQLDGTLVSGRLDAAAIDNSRISIVLDWTSDIDPPAPTAPNTPPRSPTTCV
jgi:hypothetical protein